LKISEEDIDVYIYLRYLQNFLKLLISTDSCAFGYWRY